VREERRKENANEVKMGEGDEDGTKQGGVRREEGGEEERAMRRKKRR